tara:strand:- start:6370 stop:6546 length:177 start_codon:yes stop_codon:yes gene_type:complete
MANVLSKMKDIVKAPIRYYERQKNMKIYKRVFQHDNEVFDSEDYCSHCKRGGGGKCDI